MLQRDKGSTLQFVLEIGVVLIALIVFSTVLAGSLTGASVFSKFKQTETTEETTVEGIQCSLTSIPPETSGLETCKGQGKQCAFVLESKNVLNNYPVHAANEPSQIIGFTQSIVTEQTAQECENKELEEAEALCCILP